MGLSAIRLLVSLGGLQFTSDMGDLVLGCLPLVERLGGRNWWTTREKHVVIRCALGTFILGLTIMTISFTFFTPG